MFLSELCSNPLPNVSISGLQITERYTCNWKDDIGICLDKNRYLCIEDYEIEIEYKENEDATIFDVLKENNVNFKTDWKESVEEFLINMKNHADNSLLFH